MQSIERTQTHVGTVASRLEPLFDVEWRAQPGADPVVSAETRESAHIADGEGVVAGPKLNGTCRFSFYAAECPYDPGFMEATSQTWGDIRDHVCRINPGGVIETDDGALIQFDVRGFGLRLARRAPLWSLTGGVRLVADDDRYLWLNDLVGLWEGEFNEETGVARYRIHARIPTD